MDTDQGYNNEVIEYDRSDSIHLDDGNMELHQNLPTLETTEAASTHSVQPQDAAAEVIQHANQPTLARKKAVASASSRTPPRICRLAIIMYHSIRVGNLRYGN